MATFHLNRSDSVTLDRAKALDFARKHAALPKSPTERELEVSRMKKLVNVLKEGLALPFQWATVDYGNQTYRMNGQHSSNAILEAADFLPERMGFHIDHYKVDDRQGMVELFRQFDQRWSMRSSGDVAGAFQGLSPELAQCSRKACKKAAEGLAWYFQSVVGESPIGLQMAGDDKYDVFGRRDYFEFFHFCDRLLTDKTPELQKPSVTAAIYATFTMSPPGAKTFWTGVGCGVDHFSDDSNPGAVLAAEFQKAKDDKSFRDALRPADYYKKSVKAWNAFCDGEKIRSLNVSKKGWPEVHHYVEEQAA